MIIYALKCGFHDTLHSFSAKLNFPFNNFFKYTMLQECSTEQFKMYMYRKRGWGEGGGGWVAWSFPICNNYPSISQVQNNNKNFCMIFFINTKQHNRHVYKSFWHCDLI